jgi:hypothetical protein
MMDSPDKITASRLGEEHETTVRMTYEQRDLLLQHVAARDEKFSHHPADVGITASPKGRTG